MKIVKKSKSLVREVRAVQKVMLGCFNRIISTGAERINSIRKTMSKLVFAKMAKTDSKFCK